MAVRITIRSGREKRILERHPWVFRSDIEQVKGSPAPGEIVDLYSSRNRFLARAYYNPQSQIALRIMSYKDEKIDEEFIRARIHDAVEYRRQFADLRSCRLVFAESDRLPEEFLLYSVSLWGWNSLCQLLRMRCVTSLILRAYGKEMMSPSENLKVWN